MAKRVKAPAAPKKTAKKAAPSIAVDPLRDLVKVNDGRLDEVEGDLARLAELLGQILGEPFASRAKEIVEKQQGAQKVEG